MTFKELASIFKYRSVKELSRGEGINPQTLERVRSRDQDGSKEDARCKKIILDHYNIDTSQLIDIIAIHEEIITRAADKLRAANGEEMDGINKS